MVDLRWFTMWPWQVRRPKRVRMRMHLRIEVMLPRTVRIYLRVELMLMMMILRVGARPRLGPEPRATRCHSDQALRRD